MVCDWLFSLWRAALQNLMPMLFNLPPRRQCFDCPLRMDIAVVDLCINLVPSVFVMFKMNRSKDTDKLQNTPWILEYFLTSHTLDFCLRYTFVGIKYGCWMDTIFDSHKSVAKTKIMYMLHEKILNNSWNILLCAPGSLLLSFILNVVKTLGKRLPMHYTFVLFFAFTCCHLQLPDAQVQCERWFEQPYDEMTASHLRYCKPLERPYVVC